MADYIPGKEPDKLVWVAGFREWLGAHGAGHGVMQEEIAALGEAESAAVEASARLEKLRAMTRDAADDKKAAIDGMTRLSRKLARRVQANPDTTDEDRVAAGITVAKTAKPRKRAVAIGTVAPPLIVVEYTGGDEALVHWGPNPSNRRVNFLPAGVGLCEIQVASGGVPADEEAWVHLEVTAASPLRHSIDATKSVAYAYRARYLDKRDNFGVFGEPVVFAVSMGQA